MGNVAAREVATAICAGRLKIKIRTGRNKNPPPLPAIELTSPITNPINGSHKYEYSKDDCNIIPVV
jgi:hypothetical protein